MFERKSVIILVIAGALLIPPTVAAQFCALRQPTLTFQEAFESDLRMLSVDREVTEAHREKIGNLLPFTIHRNELGTHTLYAAIGDDESQAEGYIHVRSERGRWGLTEMAWILTPRLKVKEMRVQRCRSNSGEYLESLGFQKLIRGMGLEEMRKMVSADGSTLDEAFVKRIPAENQMVALMAIRSGLKTILTTQLVWERTLAVLGYVAPTSTLEEEGRKQ